jgi:hypothetical protein
MMGASTSRYFQRLPLFETDLSLPHSLGKKNPITNIRYPGHHTMYFIILALSVAHGF